MYALFVWALVGTALATLNWVLAWTVAGSVALVLSRVRAEERILLDLFGERYVEYRREVSALGPPWQCLGFDGELSSQGEERRLVQT